MIGKAGASTWASDVRAIMDGFLLQERNQVLTYEQMGELIGKLVDGSASEYQVARERLSRDHGIEIKTIPKVGGLRLDDGGIVEELPGDRATIHRRIKRSVRRATNVEDYSALKNTQKLEHDRHLATLGIMRQLQEPQASKAIEQRVTSGLAQVDVQRLIDVLRG